MLKAVLPPSIYSLSSVPKETYLDLFLYPEGPRLRDRVSHGEADLATVGASLVTYLFSTVAATCMASLPKDHLFFEVGQNVTFLLEAKCNILKSATR